MTLPVFDTNSHFNTFRQPDPTTRDRYPDTMSDYFDVRQLHDVVFNSYEPLIRHHWALALGSPIPEPSLRLELTHPLNLTLADVEEDGERLDHFRLACLYDTMRRTSDETTGGDDSVFDYAPDGGEQIGMFLELESFAHHVKTLIGLHAFQDNYSVDEFESASNLSIYFMDCTSPLFIDTIHRLSA